MQYAISFYSVIILVLLTLSNLIYPVETYMPIIMISSQNNIYRIYLRMESSAEEKKHCTRTQPTLSIIQLAMTQY